jgi:hypothetical protein
VHRQPRAQNPFSCALSGGSPDSYCALSGVHRTDTVDCPVRPYPVFKKPFPARALGRALFLSFSLPLWRFSLPRRRPPLTGDHRAPAISCVCACSSLLSVSSSFSPSVFLPLCSVVQRLFFPPLVQISNPCEFQ